MPTLYTTWRAAATTAAVARSGSTSSWATPGGSELSAADASYATLTYGGVGFDVYSNWIVGSNFGFVAGDLPTDAVIEGVEARLQKYHQQTSGTSNGRDSLLQLTKDASTPLGDNMGDTVNNWSNSLSTYTYVGVIGAGGWNISLSRAEVLTTGFGAMLSARMLYLSGTPAVGQHYVDIMELRIAYTSASASVDQGAFFPFF